MSGLVPENAIIGGFRIAHGRHGSGPPVVVIHGTPSSSYIWRNVVPELVAAGYGAHAYDLLGYGESERPWNPEVDTSVTGQVAILTGLMDAWDLPDAHIVAHDIGGGIAQRLAVFESDRVRSLTLIDCVSFDSWPSERTRQQMKAGLASLIGAPPDRHREHFAEWLRSTVTDVETFEDTALPYYLDIICGPVAQPSFFQHQVAHYQSRHTEEISDRLEELRNTPVQIIWGADDQWQTVRWAHRLHEVIPGSALTIVPDCGHFAMEDQPTVVSQLIISFLQTV